jgi:RHS repeat-associated protein
VPTPPQNGLVGWWHLDGDTTDSSGHGLTLTNNGAQVTGGVSGKAYDFDGTACLTIPEGSTPLSLTGGTGVTMMAWVRTADSYSCPTNLPRVIMGKGFDYSLASQCADPGTPVLTGEAHPAGAFNFGFPGGAGGLTRGTWTLAAITWDGQTIRQYINGQFAIAYGGPVSQLDHLYHTFAIGCPTMPSYGGYIGSIDEVSLYSRPLTDAEIAAYYAAATNPCTYTSKADGTTCDDGNACTRSDTCQSGTCAGADPIVCTSSDQCLAPGTCNPSSGTCSTPAPRADGTSCSDGNACTLGDACQGGACVSGVAATCSDPNQCMAGTCAPSYVPSPPQDSRLAWWRLEGNGNDSGPNQINLTGSASVVGGEVGEALDFDGQGCYAAPAPPETALEGVGALTMMAWVKIPSSFPCPATNDGRIIFAKGQDYALAVSCNSLGQPILSGIVHPTVEEGYGYGFFPSYYPLTPDVWHQVVFTFDNDAGALAMYLDGVWDGGAVSDPITISNDETSLSIGCNTGRIYWVGTSFVGAIDEVSVFTRALSPAEIIAYRDAASTSTGQCGSVPKANGATCNDGDACTRTDTCQVGVCVGSSPVVCTSSEQCLAPGTCNPSSGTCSSPAPRPDGTSCSDGNACTDGDACHSGACAPGTTVSCSAGQCQVGTCDPNYAPPPAPDHVLAWWRADGNGNDSGPSHIDMTGGGASVVAGKFGEALQFDGQGCYVAPAPPVTNLNGVNEVTLMAWFKIPADFPCPQVPNTDRIIFEKGNDYGLALACDDNGRPVVGGAVHPANSYGWFHGSAPITPDVWHLAAVTSKDGVETIYLDGVQGFAYGMPPFPISNGDGALSIGCVDATVYWIGSPFVGTIDDMSIITRALGASEIAAYYNANSAGAGRCATAPAPDGTVCDDGNPASQGDACHLGTCEGNVTDGRYLPLTIVEPLNPGDTLTRPAGINRDGTITGWSGTALYPGNAPGIGFVRPEVGPSVALLPPASGVPFFPQHINAQGWVPSYAYLPSGTGEGLLNTAPGQPPMVLPITGAVSVTDVAADGSYVVGTQQAASGGTLAAWKFENDGNDAVPKADGHTSLNDFSIAASRFEDRSAGDRALTFDGTSSQSLTSAVSADNDPGTGGFTIMTWVKSRLATGPGGCPASPVPLFRRGDQFALALTCGSAGQDVVRAMVNLTGASPPPYNGTGPSIAENAWVHLAVSFDNHKLRYYVNGQPAGSQAADGGLGGAAQSVFIGGGYDPGLAFAGSLDELAVFRQPLTVDQVRLYKDGRTAYPMLFSGEEFGHYFYDGVSHEAQLSIVPPLTGGSYGGYGLPWEMNAGGDIVGIQGHHASSTGYVAAFSSYDRGTIDLNSLLEPTSDWTLLFAGGVNDSRLVVGYGLHDGQPAAFRLDVLTGEVLDLGHLPPPYDSLPLSGRAINSSGHVVGSVSDASRTYPQRAFIYTDATGLTDLNDFVDPASGWVLRSADAINDSDEIAGFATRSDYSQVRAYRLKVPSLQAISCAGKPEGAACDDHDACTVGETCHAGACAGGTPAADGTSCDDHDVCTVGETCQGGTCGSGFFLSCSKRPVGQCQNADDSCDPIRGCLPPRNLPDGTSCNDGNACTQTDVCQTGVCVGTSPVTCPGPDACHDVASTCDQLTGLCSQPPVTGTSSACAGGTYDYDKAGRLVRDHGTTLTYDAYDQLKTVTPGPSGPPLPFTNVPVTSLGYIADGTYSNAVSINMNGQISMYGTDSTGRYRGVYISGPNQDETDLSALSGGTGTLSPNRISSDGMVVGSYAAPDGASHVFRYSPAAGFQDVGRFGDASYAYAINARHEFVGPYYVGNDEHGYVYRDGVGFTDIGTLGRHTVAWTIGEDGTVGGSSQPADFFNDNVIDYAHFGHAVIWDDVVGIQDLNVLADPATTNGWVLVGVSKIIGDYYYGTGLVDGDIRPYRMSRTTHAVEALGSPEPGDCFFSDADAYGDFVGVAYEVKGDRSTATQHGWINVPGQGFTLLDDAVGANSGWKITQANSMNEAGDVVGFGVNDGKYTGYRLRLPLRTAGITPPAVAEVHGYGYDGLRTSTTTSPGMAGAKVQFWFTQDYTQHDGIREHYVRIGDRIVAKVSYQQASGGTGGTGGAFVRDPKHPPKDWGDLVAQLLVAMLLAGGLAATIAGAVGRKRRPAWVVAATGPVMLFFVASCEMLGSERKSAQTLWQRIEVVYFHDGLGAGPALTTNADGSLREERRYEPFGQPVDSMVGTTIGPVDFRREAQNSLGKLTDPDTGWSYHGARWLQPQTARWNTPDPLMKTPDHSYVEKAWQLNPYQYALQSPTRFWDPLGLADEQIKVENTDVTIQNVVEYPDTAHKRWDFGQIKFDVHTGNNGNPHSPAEHFAQVTTKADIVGELGQDVLRAPDKTWLGLTSKFSRQLALDLKNGEKLMVGSKPYRLMRFMPADAGAMSAISRESVNLGFLGFRGVAIFSATFQVTNYTLNAIQGASQHDLGKTVSNGANAGFTAWMFVLGPPGFVGSYFQAAANDITNPAYRGTECPNRCHGL